MPRYQRVEWHHEHLDEPVVLYSEIGEDSIETRKVDEYRNGRLDYAELERSAGTTFLSEKPLASVDDIASLPGFTACSISREEFEQVWHRAITAERRDSLSQHLDP